MTERSGAAYHNEYESYPARWLRNLIDAGELPDGDVDETDIREVSASKLDGYTQCHFFAGIGGWPLALKMAGWLTENNTHIAIREWKGGHNAITTTRYKPQV